MPAAELIEAEYAVASLEVHAAGIAGAPTFFFGSSATIASVVISSAATEAAF
ncbi:hypothetical protein [Bradyrhizobium erythrophlei]|uniref:hypothetical protein n=1 Tax=Bradyrhizobium erythrophlei TaxID=1437360 RepID=UPI0015C555C0|nr:hypothetical protein [Bradyrhizobium erythrophlei]